MANGTVGKTQQTAVCEKRMSHTMLQQKQQAMHSNKYPKNDSPCVCVCVVCVCECLMCKRADTNKYTEDRTWSLLERTLCALR